MQAQSHEGGHSLDKSTWGFSICVWASSYERGDIGDFWPITNMDKLTLITQCKVLREQWTRGGSNRVCVCVLCSVWKKVCSGGKWFNLFELTKESLQDKCWLGKEYLSFRNWRIWWITIHVLFAALLVFKGVKGLNIKPELDCSDINVYKHILFSGLRIRL